MKLVAQPTIHVVCSNCGSGSANTLTYILAIVAILAAVASVIGTAIAIRQYQEFIRQLHAHSNLSIQLSMVPDYSTPVPGSTDPLAITAAPRVGINPIVQAGLINRGNRVATDVTVSVLVPRGTDVEWSDGQGNAPLDAPTTRPRQTGEMLAGEDGSDVPAQWIDWTI